MRIKVLVLVLGSYMPINKYIEDVDFIHENAVTQVRNGDLFDVSYHGGECLDIKAFGDELDIDVLNDGIKLDSKEDFNMLLNSIFSMNPCRVPSEDDVIGMYGNAGVHLTFGKDVEELEDIDIEVKYNYFYKGDELPEDVDMLYIFDNADVNLSTFGTIEYIVHKCMCDTILYTWHDQDEYEVIESEEMRKNDVHLTVNKFDF